MPITEETAQRLLAELKRIADFLEVARPLMIRYGEYNFAIPPPGETETYYQKRVRELAPR